MKLIIESTKTEGGNGCYPLSIVIRDKGPGNFQRYVIHEKIYPYDRPDTNNEPFYHQGDYTDSLVTAATYYETRCKRHGVE